MVSTNDDGPGPEATDETGNASGATGQRCMAEDGCDCPGYVETENVLLVISPVCKNCGHAQNAHITDV